ncbi:MAG TPA: hypothetical protein EYO62_05015 [Aquificales bacterium]|nr:hypothetical protein [Aquificales bacterium]
MERTFKCLDCGEEFKVPFGQPRWTLKCPKCGSQNIVRIDNNRGWGCRGRGWRHGFGWRGRGSGRGWGWRRWFESQNG